MNNDNNKTPASDSSSSELVQGDAKDKGQDIELAHIVKDADRPILPFVQIPHGKITITESATRLFKIIGPKLELFNRGGKLVEIADDDTGFRILDAVAAQSRFEKYVSFIKVGKDGILGSAQITKTLAEQYLASEAFHKLTPKINGFVQCPLLIEKAGKLHLADNGYDKATGYFVVNAKPIQKLALNQAVDFVKALVQHFDFKTPGDRSRALASIITPAMKLGGIIKGPIPVDVAEANDSQAGKTYRQKVLAAVYNQKLAVVTERVGGVGSLDETFSECLVKGDTFIQFDNMRGKLNSMCLESFLTKDGAFPARIPYHGEIRVDPAKFIIFITSNGFEATKDLANRSSIIRIKKREGYHYPVYEDGNELLAQVFKWQFAFLGAVFTIIRHWHELGKKRTKEIRHDFTEWCQSLDWIVQNILEEAPLMDGHQEAKERSSNPYLTFLRRVAVHIQTAKKLGDTFSATDLFELCDTAGIEIPGITDNHRDDAEAGRKQIGKIMARLFGDKAEITIEGIAVTKHEEAGNNVAKNWQKFKTYVFSLPGEPQKVKDPGVEGKTGEKTPAPGKPDEKPAVAPQTAHDEEKPDSRPPGPRLK